MEFSFVLAGLFSCVFTGGLCPDQPPSFLSLGGILVQPQLGMNQCPSPLLWASGGLCVSFPSLPPFFFLKLDPRLVSLLSPGRHGMLVFACGKVIVWVDPFLCFLYWKIVWGSSSSAGAFPLQGFSNAFTPSVGRFRDDGVPFDSVPFLGFYFSKYFKSSLFPLEGFFLFFLRASRTSFCPLGGCFSFQDFLGFFFSLFSWPIWILFYFWLRSPFPSRMCPS